MSATITDLFNQFHTLTGSPEAAATLVLAHVQVGERPSMKSSHRDVLTPPQLGKELGVDSATVIEWIRTGQLKASNVGKGLQRPRYRIVRTDVDAFLASCAPQTKVRTERRTKRAPGELEFFK